MEKSLQLERDKARTAAELAMLEKERQGLIEKSNHQDLLIQGLKSQKTIMENPDRVISMKAAMLGLPRDGGSEVDRWKLIVQIQEAALRKTAIQKEEYERQLMGIINTKPGNNTNQEKLLKLQLDHQEQTIFTISKDYEKTQVTNQSIF